MESDYKWNRFRYSGIRIMSRIKILESSLWIESGEADS
ncbi:unnamed protein product, partial [Amoebophrya sp. A120]|eukprot:GSA120T00019346001.1